MKNLQLLGAMAPLLAALFVGCASGPTPISDAEPTEYALENGRYETLPGHEPGVVAELRAEPAPEQPELIEDSGSASDPGLLLAQGYVQIGIGYFPADRARNLAMQQGVRVGADKVTLREPQADGAAVGAADSALVVDTQQLTAHYYVRYKLPFGANFRDLNAAERTDLGVSGGVRIGSVVGGTPAAEANLLADDLVLKLNGQPIQDKAMFQTLLRANAGRAVKLSIRRGDIQLIRSVRLGVVPGVTQSE